MRPGDFSEIEERLRGAASIALLQTVCPACGKAPKVDRVWMQMTKETGVVLMVLYGCDGFHGDRPSWSGEIMVTPAFVIQMADLTEVIRSRVVKGMEELKK